MTTKTYKIDTPLGQIPVIVYMPTNPKDICVVFFHGRGEIGSGELTGNESLEKLMNSTNHANLLKHAEELGLTVFAPQLVPKLIGWNVWWTPDYIDACIDYALASLTKLPKVAIKGLSQGGGAVWTACTSAANASRIFSAVGICPTPQYEGEFSLIAKNSIPIMNFHAVNDTTVNIQSSRTMVAKANSFNPNPKVFYEEYPSGGHYIWGSVFDRKDIYDQVLKYAPTSSTPQPVPTDEIIATYKMSVYKSGKIITEAT